MSKQDIEKIEQDIDALYLGNLKTVEFDLDLPITGSQGSTISWKSSDERYLENSGKVHQLAYGKGKREVVLTATFSYGEEQVTKDYPVTVLEEENKIQVEKIYPIDMCVQKGVEVKLPTVAIVVTNEHKTISHSVTWDKGDIQVFENVGTQGIHGYLLDTSIDVNANVEVVEEVKEETVSITQKVKAFERCEVRLSDGSSFKKQQDRMLEVLLHENEDQMLYNFRATCGLDTKGAPQMIGWDTPDSKLRGHTSGHYMSALATCYAATNDERIKDKAIYMVESLLECQNTFGTLEGYHTGFLSGYSEEQFDLLEKFTPYPEIWAPYYTLHKIMAGLLDCYNLVHIEDALLIADRLGDWMYHRLRKLDNKTLKKMWGIYIAGEFGGMNESLAELYRITKKEHHLQTAKMFDNDRLFYPMTRKIDAIGGMHANQHIPQIVGAMKIFEADHDVTYYQIANYFWDIVTKAHIYTIGGTGETEMFHQPKQIGSHISDTTAETCASYNMLKLTKELFLYEPVAKYMDYYERTMQNHILSSGEMRETGASTYFMPLRPGGRKSFDVENSCCHGTGLENHFRYGDAIYHHDEQSVYVNLFVSSSISYKDFTITQYVDETKPGEVRLEIQGKGNLNLKVRVPYWCNGEYEVHLDKTLMEVETGEDGYITLSNEGNHNCIDIKFACSYYLETTPDKKDLISLHYGPYVLAALSEQESYLTLSLQQEILDKNIKQKECTCVFHDEMDNLDFVPISTIDKEAYHVYFKLK